MLRLRERLTRLLYRVRYNYYIHNRRERAKNLKMLERIRASATVTAPNERPLVSILVSTYNNSRELTERAIPSVLRQTYTNLEIIVVGDHCTDDTDERLKALTDDRVTFYNLPKRGEYPHHNRKKWQVAGVAPANKALEMCSGEWIAPLDDDDEFTDDHVEVLLNGALHGGYEMVYGKVLFEGREREPTWYEVGAFPLRERTISRISVLYRSTLIFFKYDQEAWRFNEPADWNLWRRMKEAGVRIGFVDHVVGTHYVNTRKT